MASYRTADVESSLDFSCLRLPDKLVEGLKSSGYEKPSPVQLEAIPLGRIGVDLIIQAKSGTGKTGALAVVALDSLQEFPETQVLILAPTREIAFQICQEIKSLGCAFRDLTCEAFIGGLPVRDDMAKLPECQIVVGTPGRVMQLMDVEFLKTERIKLFILDEADLLLDKIFEQDIEWIFRRLPSKLQVIAICATYPPELEETLLNYMDKPSTVQISSKDPALLGIAQYYCASPFHKLPQIKDQGKFDVLMKIFRTVTFQQCMIFCQRQEMVQALTEALVAEGYRAAGISSFLDQITRLKIMKEWKSFQVRVLVSTDLTARGIDAENVNMVINFDMPRDGEVYMNRIGRAGRYGTRGTSITLVSEGIEVMRLKLIQKKFFLKIYKLPDPIPPDFWDITFDVENQNMEELINNNYLLRANAKTDTTVHDNPSELDGSTEKKDSAMKNNYDEDYVQSSDDEKHSSSEINGAVINEEKYLVSSENIVAVVNRVTGDQAASQKQDGLQADVPMKKSDIPFHAKESKSQAEESSIGKDSVNSNHKVQLTKSEDDSISLGVKQADSGLFREEIPKANSQSVRRKDKIKEGASCQERKLQKQRGNAFHASKISSSEQSSMDENEMTEYRSSLTQRNGEMGRKSRKFFAPTCTSVHPQVAKANVDYRENWKMKTPKSKRDCRFQNHHENEVNAASLNLGVDYRKIGKAKSTENCFQYCREDQINSADFEDAGAGIGNREMKPLKSKSKYSYHRCYKREISSVHANRNPVNYGTTNYFSHADFHEECGHARCYQNGVGYLPSNVGGSSFRSSARRDISPYCIRSPCLRDSSLPYSCCCEIPVARPRNSCSNFYAPQCFKNYMACSYHLQQLTSGYCYM